MAGLYACHAGQDQHACAATISVISAAGWPTPFLEAARHERYSVLVGATGSKNPGTRFKPHDK